RIDMSQRGRKPQPGPLITTFLLFQNGPWLILFRMGVIKCKTGLVSSLLITVFIGFVLSYWDIRLVSILPLQPLPAIAPAPKTEVVEDTIQKNATLVATLVDYEVPVAIAHEVANLIKPIFDLRKVRFGNPFRLEKQDDGSLARFEYKI